MMMSAALYLGWVSAMEERYAALFRWASLLLATPVALWCAEPFFSGAIQGLKNRVLHMDLPIALAVAVLYVHGLVSTLVGTDTYFDSLSMLVALLLAGRMLDAAPTATNSGSKKLNSVSRPASPARPSSATLVTMSNT